MVIAQSSNEHLSGLMAGGESEVRRVTTRGHETLIKCLLILGQTSEPYTLWTLQL